MTRIVRSCSLALAATIALTARVDAQLDGRSFTVSTSMDTARVGDTIRVRFRLLLHERDLLTDTVPRPVAELPEGIRVYSVEKLVRGTDRVFSGEAVVAFFRPGTQELPAFGVPWVQVVTGHRGIVASETGKVEIVPVLPAGNPTLRDIRELERTPGPGPLPLVAVGVALVGLAVVLLRRRAPKARPAAVPLPVAPPPPRDAYGLALGRLASIEREPEGEPGAVAARYERVADVLRDYLETAEEIPARERTTSELLWAMPPRLTEGGLRRLTGEVLGEADLVKFARRRPDAAAAGAYLGEARELLRRWHAASAGERTDADALR